MSTSRFLITTLLGMSLCSCDSMIFDDQGDCSVRYNVSFSYTQNMLSANAFSSQVTSITLYVVDKEGNIVFSKADSSSALSSPDYSMEVDVKPGQYDLYVWGEGESPVVDNVSFVIGDGAPLSNVRQLTASLPLNQADGRDYCDHDIKPLFYGSLTNVDFSDTYGNVALGPVDLMRDTHQLQVLIQSLDGTVIDPGEFSFYVEDNNSRMNHLNAVLSSPWFEYRPWQVTATHASFDDAETRADEVNGLIAEFTLGRLMADSTPRLIIHRNGDNTDIIRLNLIQYLLMVKGEYNTFFTNQQYLDRKDSHTMMFFLDADRNWYTAAGVYINGWRIVPDEEVTL